MTEHRRPFVTNHMVRKTGRQIKEKMRDLDPWDHKFITATYILATFQGHKWAGKRVFPQHPNFLSPGLTLVRSSGRLPTKAFDLSEAKRRSFKHNEAMQRTIELAEAFFNLQGVSGFESALKRFRNDDSLEPEMAALLVAKMLVVSGRMFRFVGPIGKPGKDYDLEVTYNGARIACEVKCKRVSTSINYTAVLDTLKDSAEKQLPSDMPAVFCVYFPPELD
jgi:hypothetical protein